MRNWLTSLQPNPWLTRKLVMLAILIAVGVAAFFVGRRQTVQADGPNKVSSTPGATPEDYERRVVAYLYDNNTAVTRAELGEYLIARFGGERLDFLVNRKIVELECYKRNIVVSDAEVEERLKRDLQAFGQHVTEHDFVNSILRKFGKTLYEWKEDVIRPKLMMEKLVRPMIQITDRDALEGFEARYGPKVECRMIVLDAKANAKVAEEVYHRARQGHKEFLEEARKQFIPNLAQAEGKVPPIHKHFGDKRVEEVAFGLKVGDVTLPLLMEDKTTYVIMYCEKHVPEDKTKKFEQERMNLLAEMKELRVAQKIPEKFAELRKLANPRLMLSKEEPRGTMPTVQQPSYQPSQPAVRTDIPPLVPTPVKAPEGSGFAPLSNSISPLPPVEIPRQGGVGLPSVPNATPSYTK